MESVFQVCERSVTVSVTVEGRYLVAPCNDCACPPLPGTDAHGGDIAEGVGWDEEEAEGLVSRSMSSGGNHGRADPIRWIPTSAGYQQLLDTNGHGTAVAWFVVDLESRAEGTGGYVFRREAEMRAIVWQCLQVTV